MLLEYYLSFNDIGKLSMIMSSFVITLSNKSCLETVGVEKYMGLVRYRLWGKVNSGVLSSLCIALHLKGVCETAWNDLTIKLIKDE